MDRRCMPLQITYLRIELCVLLKFAHFVKLNKAMPSNLPAIFYVIAYSQNVSIVLHNKVLLMIHDNLDPGDNKLPVS